MNKPDMTSLMQRWRNLSTLQVALLLSVGVHAALLTVRFVDPSRFDKLFADASLEVVLVNARSSEAPTQAQALAQANLAGGGDVEKGMASSPLPPQRWSTLGDTLEDEQRKQEALQQQQRLMVSDLKQQIAHLSAANNAQDSAQEHAAAEEKRRKLLEVLGEIEKRIQEQNARPKKRFISPATREVSYAMYYDGMRRKIEDKGTENFPASEGRKLYGELIVSITVDGQGRVLQVQVDHGSGTPALDRQAVAIARGAAPFGPFSSGMNRNEHLVVVAQFKFTREQTLETQLMRPQ